MMHTNTKVSVLIPVYNEEVGIKLLLDRIIDLKFHESYEIIIVNDGSSDRSLEVVKN